MTDIINVDLEKIIESSISELTKKLSSELNKKVREDVINNLMMNITTKSIYGLDDIKDFGKLCGDYSPLWISSQNKFNLYFNSQASPTIYENFSIEEYPILYSIINESNIIYITNVIDGLLLNNDDILFLILISLKMTTRPGYCYMTTRNDSDIVIPLLIKNNFINNGERGDKKLDKSLKRYFASVHDNKIKAFEFDKLLKKYKELEVSINNNKKELDESKDKYEISNDENGMYKDEIKELIKLIKNTELEINKQKEIIIDLEDKNKNLEEEIIKQSKKLKEIKEIEILNLEEEYNKLFTVFTETKDENNKTKEELNKTKEENIKLSDEWLILKDKTIAKFEEDNYKLRMEKDKLVKNNNELKKELGKILKENNNLIEENKNVNSKIIELIEDMKNMSNENNNKFVIE